MLVSLTDNEGQIVRSLPPLVPTFSCAMYEATSVSPLKING